MVQYHLDNQGFLSYRTPVKYKNVVFFKGEGTLEFNFEHSAITAVECGHAAD